MIMLVLKAVLRVAKRAVMCERFSFSTLRLMAALASTSKWWVCESQARRSEMVTRELVVSMDLSDRNGRGTNVWRFFRFVELLRGRLLRHLRLDLYPSRTSDSQRP